MLKNRKITTKLALGFALPLIMMVALAGGISKVMSSLKGQSDKPASNTVHTL